MTTTENNVAAQAGDEPMRAVVALAWKWHDEAVADGFAASEPAQELFALLGCPDRGAAGITQPADELEPTEAYWAVTARGERCAFGRYGFAKAWAGKNGTVETVQLRQFTLIESEVSPRATADVERNLRAELINEGALRQYCHNDGSTGFVTAYDFDITNRFLAAIATTKPGA